MIEALWPIRKDAHEKARAFDTVAQMPGFFLFVTNPRFELIYANDYFYEFFECSPSDLIGKSLYCFLNDGILPCISDGHIREVINEGFVWNHEAATSKPDGEPVTVKWSQTYLHDKKNPIIVTMGLIQDDAKKNADGGDAELPPEPAGRMAFNAEPIREWRGLAVPEIKTAVGEQEIQYALEHKSFELYYQPLIHSRTKKITGAEALLRMNHPTRGRLFPAYILPTAEKSGQIISIGNFVIDSACAKINEWAKQGIDITVSVNLSHRQFLHGELAETILRAVTLHDVTAGHLLLDVTEDTLARDPEKARGILSKLRQLGCKICLDDFGTGFSSLKNLENLEIDCIKIDRSFLPGGSGGRKSYAIVESIIMLSHGLGFTVTVSGVETEVQAEMLMELSCDHFQGFLFSRPVPVKDFDRLLNTPDFYIRNVKA